MDKSHYLKYIIGLYMISINYMMSLSFYFENQRYTCTVNINVYLYIGIYNAHVMSVAKLQNVLKFSCK